MCPQPYSDKDPRRLCPARNDHCPGRSLDGHPDDHGDHVPRRRLQPRRQRSRRLYRSCASSSANHHCSRSSSASSGCCHSSYVYDALVPPAGHIRLTHCNSRTSSHQPRVLHQPRRHWCHSSGRRRPGRRYSSCCRRQQSCRRRSRRCRSRRRAGRDRSKPRRRTAERGHDRIAAFEPAEPGQPSGGEPAACVRLVETILSYARRNGEVFYGM